MADNFIKISDQLEKSRRAIEIQKIIDSEEIYNKGYWKFNKNDNDYIYIEPKINTHFVTVQDDCQSSICNIILSKKPMSLESMKFDYPWEAEWYCIGQSEFYLKRRKYLHILRKAQVFIADSDICCPCCLNSSPLEIWINNSYKHEMKKPPFEHKDLNFITVKDQNVKINDIKTEKVWCPICNNGIDDRKNLMQKGDEWKAQFYNKMSFPKYRSKYLEMLLNEMEKTEVEYFKDLEETEKVEKFVEDIGSLDNLGIRIYNNRRIITNPLEVIINNLYKGLVARVIEKVKLKDGYIYKTKWIEMKNGLPDNCKFMKGTPTSYKHSSKPIPEWMPKNEIINKIVYVPISDIVLPPRPYFTNEELENEISKFHSGEQLEIVYIGGKNKLVVKNDVLVKLAEELGLSHIPVLILGIDTEKREDLENQYKDGIIIGG